MPAVPRAVMLTACDRSGGVLVGMNFAAIPVMHYTGMAAAKFMPTSTPPDLSHAVSITALGTAGIAMVTLVVLGLAILTSLFDRRYSAQTLELESAEATLPIIV